jgi:hypothetical protein
MERGIEERNIGERRMINGRNKRGMEYRRKVNGK